MHTPPDFSARSDRKSMEKCSGGINLALDHEKAKIPDDAQDGKNMSPRQVEVSDFLSGEEFSGTEMLRRNPSEKCLKLAADVPGVLYEAPADYGIFLGNCPSSNRRGGGTSEDEPKKVRKPCPSTVWIQTVCVAQECCPQGPNLTGPWHPKAVWARIY